ncbi:hypothetical protein LZ30DRAFT_437536 [Colletotrichum cereale]|nr:hypothetical protein LZ30DRAFT_437536 [Colletotrichum cereale]
MGHFGVAAPVHTAGDADCGAGSGVEAASPVSTCGDACRCFLVTTFGSTTVSTCQARDGPGCFCRGRAKPKGLSVIADRMRRVVCRNRNRIKPFRRGTLSLIEQHPLSIVPEHALLDGKPDAVFIQNVLLIHLRGGLECTFSLCSRLCDASQLPG